LQAKRRRRIFDVRKKDDARMILRCLSAAMAAVLALGLSVPVLAEKKPEDPVEKHFKDLEKQIKQLRSIVLQAKDTGQPVQVRITTDPDPVLESLTQKVEDLEEAARSRNAQIDSLTQELATARRAGADDKAQIKALQDRLAAAEAKVKSVEDAQQAAIAAATSPTVSDVPPSPGGAAAPANGDGADAFRKAKQLLLEGQYPDAQSAFQGFVDAYADSPYAPEAYYWLGETLYVRGLYSDAAPAYIGAIRGWPQTSWAPDAVIKLARSLIALKKPQDACRTLGEFKKRYAGAPPPVQAKAQSARAAAKCTA
jgi:tol-pal system protein YbgF